MGRCRLKRYIVREVYTALQPLTNSKDLAQVA
jgi:hypothetical protein